MGHDFPVPVDKHDSVKMFTWPLRCGQKSTIFLKRANYIKGLILPPLMPKTESCLTPISSEI